jgi:hypothetical protein
MTLVQALLFTFPALLSPSDRATPNAEINFNRETPEPLQLQSRVKSGPHC